MLLLKKLNLVNTLPQSNWSALICLPNKLFDFILNSMNLYKALDFLYARYTYPNLEYSSIKVMKYSYFPMYEH